MWNDSLQEESGMTRYIVLVFVSLLLSTAAAAANVGISHQHRAGSQRHDGWMGPDANPAHAWLYVSGSNDITVYDLKRLGTPRVGRITQGISSPGGIALDASGTL